MQRLSGMRIRPGPAITFPILLLLSAWLGFSSYHPPINDKVIHGFTFFTLTICFYWILDASRRRVTNLTLAVVTLGLGIASEVVQDLVTSHRRAFDPLDIVANLVGSGAAVGLCSWYHKRMLERRRAAKQHYVAVPGDELPDDGDVEFENVEHSGGSGDEDLERGEAGRT